MSPHPKMNPTVRPFRADDVAPAASIIADTPLWRDRYAIDLQRAQGLLRAALDRGDGLIAAENAGTLAGFAWYVAKGAFAKSGYLRIIAVSPAQRGGGVGAAVLTAVESAVGGDLVILVSDFNDDAQRFYQRHGYAEIGRLPGYVLPGVAEVILWKRR